jgi:hypothetical protein
MTFSFQSHTVSVGTTEPVLISQFRPTDISSVVFKSAGTVYLGFGGVSSTSGFPLLLGESLNLTYQDFSKEMLAQNTLIKVYAIATADTSISVLSLRK